MTLTVLVWANNGVIVDSYEYTIDPLVTNISIGKTIDGGSTWKVCTTPTEGAQITVPANYCFGNFGSKLLWWFPVFGLDFCSAAVLDQNGVYGINLDKSSVDKIKIYYFVIFDNLINFRPPGK